MLVRLEDVCVSFQERRILERISVIVRERRVGVIGPNGSGKSTFVRLLNGLVMPSSGRVVVGGLDTREHVREIRRRVGFVFQNPDNQIVFPIVSEDLAFGLSNLGMRRAEATARVVAELERFGLSHLFDRQSHTLSGGEKQMVALAAVLVMRPDLIVFDEPTTLLDLRNRNRIRAAIAAMPQDAVVVTHDLDLLQDFERVLVVDDGRIVMDDGPSAATRWYEEHLS